MLQKRLPVLFRINFSGDRGIFELSSGYSAYPEEEEVIIQDGLKYKVINNTDNFDEEKQMSYKLIELVFPAN